MEVIVAKHLGFCFGVEEAMKKTEKALENYPDKKILTYGPLIHNAQVIERLKNKGVKSIDSIEDADENSIVIIRSHGVSKKFYEEATRKNIELIDATCIFVNKIQKIVEEAYKNDENIVIIGDKKHPEVIGLNGWCDNTAIIIENEDDAKEIQLEKITIVVQTTSTKEVLDKIVNVFKDNNIKINLNDTICSATKSRQLSCEEVSKKVDAMIIIGGANSSNSAKLYQISQKYCNNSYFIETICDLPLKKMQKYNKIGVAAGASTPEWIIEEVITIMSELSFQDDALEYIEAETMTPENDMESLMAEIEKSLRIPTRGEIVKGSIILVNEREVVVNLGCKKDGIIPKNEITMETGQNLKEMFDVGAEIQAQVIKSDDGEGNLLLSKRKVDAFEHWNEISDMYDNNAVIDVSVVNKVKGGVIASYKDVTGFIPISQLANRFVDNVDEFIGKILPVKITQLNKRRNKIVFSHRTFLDEERKLKIASLWGNINENDIIEGKIMRFTNYGAFIDVGGIDGLLHISEISWGKITHPSDVLKIGESVKVKILSIDKDNEKVSLGLKQISVEPWKAIDDKFKVDDIIDGKVVQIKDYGVFVEIEPGMDGLVHISEMSYKHVASPSTEVQLGQIVKSKILDIDKENKRISLSIKAASEKPAELVEKEAAEKIEEAAE